MGDCYTFLSISLDLLDKSFSLKNDGRTCNRLGTMIIDYLIQQNISLAICKWEETCEDVLLLLGKKGTFGASTKAGFNFQALKHTGCPD